MAIVEPFELWPKTTTTAEPDPPTSSDLDTWTAADTGSLGATDYVTTSNAASSSQVENTQSQLNALGYNAGAVDGIAGPNTAAAVSAFQAANGLAVTGEIDTATTSALSNPPAANQVTAYDPVTPDPVTTYSYTTPPSDLDIWGTIDAGSLGNPNPVDLTPEQQATNIVRAASPQIEAAEAAQVEADSAQGFADWAVADAATLGIIDAPTILKVEEDANTVRREELPALIETADKRTAAANRAVAIETLEELGVDPTEANIESITGVLAEATSDEERQNVLEQTVDGYEKQQTYQEVRLQVDVWVTEMLGNQGALLDREDLLLDVESMVVDGQSPAQIEFAIRDRLENIRTRGLDSISNGTVVEGFSEADVINAGLRVDQGDREDTQRQVLDTLQVTLGVGSDEALAAQLGVTVDQLGNTLLVRNAQNAASPEDAIAQLKENPQYQANAERRRLADIATWAIADGSGYGATIEDMGFEGITDLAAQGDIIENSGAVDATLVELSLSISSDGETVAINLTQEQRNELALEHGFLNRNDKALGLSPDDINDHIAVRANALHWQNQSRQDIADWQAEGIIPEFGYDSMQSGLRLDFENNAARTAWALEVADQTADSINSWQSERIGVTEGVENATTRLRDHYENNPLDPGSQEFNSINYTFNSISRFESDLAHLQENPSVDEIQEFRARIDEFLNNDWYHLPDDTRALFEDMRAEFDDALAGAQRTRDAARGDINLAGSQLRYDDMQENFDRVVDESGGWLGKVNRELFSLDDQFLGVHADATEEEITAFEALASIPEEERSVDQNAAYSVLAQGLLGKNLTTGTTSGATRFDQGEQRANSYEESINDNSKQSIILGSAIVGTGVSLFNPVAGGAIIVGGTGVGLSIDKVTGNDHLSWKEIGTETGISLGSTATGFGVSKFVSGSTRFIAPTSRGGQVALAGGVFLTEELTSEVLINAGSSLARGEGINTQTLFDPVGLLYGLPFAAGDARRIMRGSPSVGATVDPNAPRIGVVDSGSLSPTQVGRQQIPDNPDYAPVAVGGDAPRVDGDTLGGTTSSDGVAQTGRGGSDDLSPDRPLEPESPLPQLTAGDINTTDEFLNVDSLQDLKSRIPYNAEQKPWTTIEGSAAQGIKWEWTDGEGKRWRVRAHEMDPGAPVWVNDPGVQQTNASSNWVYRVEVKPTTGPWRWVDNEGAAHKDNVLNPNSPFYDPEIANDTHIPIGANSPTPRQTIPVGPVNDASADLAEGYTRNLDDSITGPGRGEQPGGQYEPVAERANGDIIYLEEHSGGYFVFKDGAPHFDPQSARTGLAGEGLVNQHLVDRNWTVVSDINDSGFSKALDDLLPEYRGQSGIDTIAYQIDNDGVLHVLVVETKATAGGESSLGSLAMTKKSGQQLSDNWIADRILPHLDEALMGRWNGNVETRVLKADVTNVNPGTTIAESSGDIQFRLVEEDYYTGDLVVNEEPYTIPESVDDAFDSTNIYRQEPS